MKSNYPVQRLVLVISFIIIEEDYALKASTSDLPEMENEEFALASVQPRAGEIFGLCPVVHLILVKWLIGCFIIEYETKVN